MTNLAQNSVLLDYFAFEARCIMKQAVDTVEYRHSYQQPTTMTRAWPSWIHCLAAIVIIWASQASRASGAHAQLNSALVPSGANASVVLDFTGIEGRATIMVYLYGRNFTITDGPYNQELDFLTISVHNATVSGDYKVLVTLAHLNCNGSAFLWIEDESGEREEYCSFSHTEFIISEGQHEVTIGISSDWTKYHYATLKAAAYYDPTDGDCECDNQWDFCCLPCSSANTTHDTHEQQLASDSLPTDADTGYCMNKNETQRERCDYWYYCPCSPSEEPDWSNECPYDDSPGEGFPIVGIYIAIALTAGGIILATGVICCPIICCCRRMCAVHSQSSDVDASRTRIAPPHPNWNTQFENVLPPSYEAISGSEVKQMKVLDFVNEPSPPPYECVTKA